MCQIYHLFAKKSESGPKCQIMFPKLKFKKKKKKSNLQKKKKERKNRKQNKKKPTELKTIAIVLKM